jgi:hypothetical protein
VTSFFIKKGQNAGIMNVQPLEEIMLGKNNSFIMSYWKKLPNYEVLLKPLYKILVDFACLYPTETTTDTAPTVSFCGGTNYAYTEPPFDLAFFHFNETLGKRGSYSANMSKICWFLGQSSSECRTILQE